MEREKIHPRFVKHLGQLKEAIYLQASLEEEYKNFGKFPYFLPEFANQAKVFYDSALLHFWATFRIAFYVLKQDLEGITGKRFTARTLSKKMLDEALSLKMISISDEWQKMAKLYDQINQLNLPSMEVFFANAYAYWLALSELFLGPEAVIKAAMRRIKANWERQRKK